MKSAEFDKFLPTAVPLVTSDPYFSLWSCADHLTDDYVRAWTGKRNTMTGIIKIDGKPFRFIGKAYYDRNNECLPDEPEGIIQTDIKIHPVSTEYTFENDFIKLVLTFTSPQLLKDPVMTSMPVTYIEYEVSSKDKAEHDISVYFDFSAEMCTDSDNDHVVSERFGLPNGLTSIELGNKEQKVLGRSGDRIGIDWGYLNITVKPDDNFRSSVCGKKKRYKYITENRLPRDRTDISESKISDDLPIIAFTKEFRVSEDSSHKDLFIISYNDVESINYFGKHLKGYWTTKYSSFEEMICCAYDNRERIIEECAKLNEKLEKEAYDAGGQKYQRLCSLAYRQAVASHKAVYDDEDGMLFFSKECTSNGCIGTVDVSYPSIPLFLLYNTEFVKSMMKPVFRFASSEYWTPDFAPHDVGTYPFATGQVYGINEDCSVNEELQMPVEECGNMLIMTYLVSMLDNSTEFADRYFPMLEKWAGYLYNAGIELDNQLCTDDFAGHTEQNVNLAVKSVTGIKMFAELCRMKGMKEKYEKYDKAAKKYASELEKKAYKGDHTLLSLKDEDSWSLKYNLIWDNILKLGLFSDKMINDETAYYIKKINKYGTPLDSRNTYTKSDWLAWAAALSDTDEKFSELISPLYSFITESTARDPFPDWYDTVSAGNMGFKNRTVVGGIFIKILKDRLENIK